MKTILVPVDLSAASIPVCAVACGLARRTGAGLRLLHLVQQPAEESAVPRARRATGPPRPLSLPVGGNWSLRGVEHRVHVEA